MNYCCKINCKEDAIWLIEDETSNLTEDYTHSCNEHLSNLLYEKVSKVVLLNEK